MKLDGVSHISVTMSDQLQTELKSLSARLDEIANRWYEQQKPLSSEG